MDDEWRPTSRRPAGLCFPVRCDPTGVAGPTWKRANGPGWERVGPGLYAPRTRPRVVEQRILDKGARLSGESWGCVTGWAALRWRGAAFFDGMTPDGRRELDVELNLGDVDAKLRPAPGVHLSRKILAPCDREVVAGLRVTSVQRALFDEIARRGDLVGAVQAIDMTAAAGLISVWLFATYLGRRNALVNLPLARHAVSLAVDESRSPRETWLRLVWVLDLELPEPLVNQPVYDLQGRLLGVPDLLDPVAGLVIEYDGAHHKDRAQHRADVAREQRFREHGLEYAAVVAGDSREVVARRLRGARSRARFVASAAREWTTSRPAWDPAPETLDVSLERQGLVERLTAPGRD